MKKWVAAFVFVIVNITLQAQDNYGYVDRKVLQIPKAETFTTTAIASYINTNFTTANEKIRAVYTWVITNIEYSKDSMYQFNRWGIDPEINMNSVLRRRKGVCENYAALFANLLVKCGIQAVVVTGYTTINNNAYWNGHGWVAVKINNEWLLCDPTWDSGYNTYNYFLVQPANFVRTHMPFDPLWQLVDDPISHKDFQRGRYRTKNDTTVFNYKDSVTAYLQADTLQQMLDASRRMRQWGFDNDDLQTWYNFNEMKVHIVLQEENMELFNNAVDNLNKAKKLYNDFVQYRNDQFASVKPVTEINSLFASANNLIETAYKKLDMVGRKSENYQYDTDGLKENLDALMTRLKAQEEFWKEYVQSQEAATKKTN